MHLYLLFYGTASGDAPQGHLKRSSSAADFTEDLPLPKGSNNSQFVPGLQRMPTTPDEFPEVMTFESSEDGTRGGNSGFKTIACVFLHRHLEIYSHDLT